MGDRHIGSEYMDGRATLSLADTEALEEDAAYRVLPRWLWRLFSVVWLFFLIFPITGLPHPRPASGRLLITLVGMGIIVAIYLRLMLHHPFPDTAHVPSAHWLPVALLALLATWVIILTHADGDNWYWFFTYAGLAAGVALPTRRAIGMLVVLTISSAAVGVRAVGWLQTGRIVFLVAVGCFGMIGVGHLLRTIRELRAARAEIARLAVAEERLRFARDLHDLLGHSLSTIAIKTALAYRLLPDTPERAMHELADIQTVTQDALKEVREAVTGYRQPMLATELANAREILTAAEIACQCDNAAGALPAAVESVLAWTVREGVTNIVRHSRARHATITVHRQSDTVHADISDDGEGALAEPSVSSGAVGGSGLAGLAERAAAQGGSLDAGPGASGGFRLAVSLPLDKC